jgi:uncharacterized protein (TIGR00369 family)
MSETLSAAQIQEGMAKSPFIAFMGLEVLTADVEKQQITMRMPMRPEFERRAGTGQWHGGAIASAIDTVGDSALAMLIGRPLPTVNFRVDYLKPAVNTALKVVATVRRNGKSVGVVDVDVYDAKESLLAIGRATYSTLPA